jgi:hypothetical protein
MDAKKYLEKLSTDKLLQLVEEMKKPSHSIVSPLRKVVRDIWPGESIFVLRVTELVWPMLEILAERSGEEPKGKRDLKKEKIKQLAPKMHKAIDKLINCDHYEHFATRLNDQEMEAIDTMKKILVSVEKHS